MKSVQEFDVIRVLTTTDTQYSYFFEALFANVLQQPCNSAEYSASRPQFDTRCAVFT